MADDTERRPRTLRAQGLADADAQRLAAFLRIGSERLRYRWELAAGDACDLLVVGGEETVPMDVPGSDVAGLPVLRVVEAGAFEGVRGQLCRPLGHEDLVEQLLWVERLSRAALAPRDDRVAEAAASDPAQQPPPLMLRAGDRYRLGRLPSAAALGSDPRLRVVASLLTIRPVLFEELVARSPLAAADCRTALQALAKLGVLQVAAGPAPPPASEPARQARRPGAGPDPTPPGMLARLRGRLGLG